MFRITAIATGLFWCCVFGADAQDFTFSQYQAIPLLVNPSETGSIPGKHVQRISAIFRTQWDVPATDGGIYGSGLGWDRRFCDTRAANTFWSIGAYAQHSGTNGGGIYNLHFRGTASLHVVLNETLRMAFGASAGGLNYGFDPGKLLFNQQYDLHTGDFTGTDNGETFARENNIVFDMDAGFRIFGEFSKPTNNDIPKGWSVGFALHHLTSPKYTFLPSPQDQEANRLDIGLSVQVKVRPTDHLVFDGFFRRQAISNAGSLQWQAVLGAGYAFFGKQDNELTIGFLGRFSGQENRIGQLARWTGIPYLRIRLGRWMIGGSVDLNFSKLPSDPPGSIELTAACFLGQQNCPTPCW